MNRFLLNTDVDQIIVAYCLEYFLHLDSKLYMCMSIEIYYIQVHMRPPGHKQPQVQPWIFRQWKSGTDLLHCHWFPDQPMTDHIDCNVRQHIPWL